MSTRQTFPLALVVGLVAGTFGCRASEAGHPGDVRASSAPTESVGADRWRAVRELEPLRERMLGENEARVREQAEKDGEILDRVACDAYPFREVTSDATRRDWPELRFFESTMSTATSSGTENGMFAIIRCGERRRVGIFEGAAEPMFVGDPGELGAFLVASGVTVPSSSAIAALVDRVCFQWDDKDAPRSLVRVRGRAIEIENPEGRWTFTLDRERRVKSVRKRNGPQAREIERPFRSS